MNDNTLHGLYERTMNNCLYYEREAMWISLANEIGCLRGIAYCLEIAGDNSFYGDKEFLRLIAWFGEFSNDEKEAEREQIIKRQRGEE